MCMATGWLVEGCSVERCWLDGDWSGRDWSGEERQASGEEMHWALGGGFVVSDEAGIESV